MMLNKIRNNRIKYWIVLFIVTISSCESNKKNQSQQELVFSFAVLEDSPIFEDEYLFEKQEKKCLVEEYNGISIYHCDWNNNGDYKERAVDYIGVKSVLEKKPTIVKLDSTVCININAEKYVLAIEEKQSKLKKASNCDFAELNIISKLSPILLDNGGSFMPKITMDTAVIYFWATWCGPCVKTLENIDVEKLEQHNIQFIPIAYNCSGVKEFFSKNNLNFEDLVISEKGAKDYNIQALSKMYTFLKNGQLADRNLNLNNYYK